MKIEMEVAEGEEKLLGDLLELIRFTEGVSAKLHRVLDEAEIYQVVKEEFAKTNRWTASILLLADDGASLRLVETSIAPSKLEVLGKASGLQWQGYKIDLKRSSIYSQVVREGKTVQVNVSDTIREFLPRPLAYLISKTMGYEKKLSILTPLHRQGKVIGAFAVSCTNLREYFIHSVENLALHISTALELTHKHAQRNRAVQALKRYHDHLGDLVEERTGELKTVNEQLREEITERRQAEEALRKIEQEKLAVLNSMSEHVVYQDTEHRILWTNKAAAESVALSIEQLVGRHCYEIWPQRSKPCVGCPLIKARETGKPQKAEMTTPDGRVWFIRGYPVRDANENLVGVVEVTLEVTERKQADEALQAEKNKLQSLIDAMEDGLTIQDRDFNIIYQNESVRMRHGDHLGEKCYRVYEGREKLCEGCPVKIAFKDGKSHTSERRVVIPSGEVTFWEVTANPIRDAEGRIVSCLEIARNITERKQAEEALRENEEFSSSLLTNAPNPVLVIDQDTSVRYVNPAFEKLSGFSSTEVIGRKAPYLWWTEETLKKTTSDLKQAMRKGAVRIEELFNKKNGERFWVEITSTPLRKDGEYKYYLANWVDITERKRAEEALREGEEKYKELAGSITDLFFAFDKDLRYTYWNKASEELTGIPAKDALGKHLYDIFPDAEMTRSAERIYLKALRTQKVQSFVNEFQIGDKDYFFEISAYPSKDGLSVFAKDITERKQAEEALRESEEKFQKMVESVTDGISVIDLNGAIIETNQRTVEMHGFASKDELLGRNALELVAPADHERIAKNMQKALKQGIIRGEEYTLLKADGTEFPGELSTSVIRGASGKPVAHITIARDITERKRTREALRESEERFRSIVENSQAGIMILDDAYRLVYANGELYRISGYSPKEVIGQDFRKFLDEESKELVAERYIRRQRGEEVPPRYEFNIIKKDGQKRRVEISSSVIKDSAGEVRTIAQILDITERKGAEEALQAEKNKLQSLVDAMEYGLTIQDKDFNIIYQNELVETIFGDHLGEKCYRVYEGKEKLCAGCPVKKAFKDGKSHTSERRVVLPSGEVTFWENTANPIRDAGGKIVSCLEITRNITERKQAEEQLRESQQFSSSLLESSPNPILVVNPDTSIRYINPALEKLTGFTLAEVEGEKAPHPWWPKEQIEEITAAFKKHIAMGGRRSERNFQKKNGEHFWVALDSAQVMHKGKPAYLIMNWLDITERKQVEQALADEATRRRILVDQSLDGIVVLDENSKVYEANQRFAEMLGYTPEEVRELHTWDWDTQWTREELLEMARKVDETGFHLDTYHRRKDGTTIDVEISVNGAMCAGQKLIFCVCRDVTERKQAEEALRESQKFSSSLLESSPNPISVVDLDTSVRYVNPAFEKLTGFTLDEIVGRKAPYPWWPEGKRARILAAFKDAIEHGGRRTERNFKHKNGGRFWVALTSAPVMHEGKAIYLIISWLDITERKRAGEKEKQLQQELYLAQRLASVGELAAGVAHEINNPLTGVLGFSQRLMRKSTDEQLSRDLEIIHSEARRAAEVVQNLLTFARRRQPKKEYANINDIVNKTLELRAYALHTSNIEVVTNLAPDLLQIMVDFPQMQEVFLNVILNAEQAMSETHGKGKLIVKTRQIKDYVRISFADDGPGIPPENLDKVFDPFFTTRAEGGGTGLGLSACHGIVTEHGGRIYVRSKPGKGATFFIELPLSPVRSTSVS